MKMYFKTNLDFVIRLLCLKPTLDVISNILECIPELPFFFLIPFLSNEQLNKVYYKWKEKQNTKYENMDLII